MANFISRPASADDAVLINAREAMALAQTLKQLRQAQAVVLPPDYAMSLAPIPPRSLACLSWVLVVGSIKAVLDKRLGHKVALA